MKISREDRRVLRDLANILDGPLFEREEAEVLGEERKMYAEVLKRVLGGRKPRRQTVK